VGAGAVVVSHHAGPGVLVGVPARPLGPRAC
jgi:serine acetyltransferase